MVAEVLLSCGRRYLLVCGFTLAMEGDKCRDGSLPEAVLPPIPEEELACATMGGKAASELPIDLVRFFRGENWTKEMLEYVCDEINRNISTNQADDGTKEFLQIRTPSPTSPRTRHGHTWRGKDNPMRPTIVCLCGSTRFSEAFQEANLRETLKGNIVLSVGCDMRSDNELWADPEERERIKARLDVLHLHKIDLASVIIILNVGGYIGSSTRRELEYALSHNKAVRFLEPCYEFDAEGQ